MGKRRDIMYSYHKENCEDRFEFMYEHYYYYKTVLSSRKACTIYSIERYMRKEHWDEYFKLYNVQKREALISRVSASMDKGESIDYLICEEGLPESILEHYKDYLAMKIDFRIFSCALKSIGGKDEELLRRYDEQYGKIEEIETLIAEVQEQIQTIRREQISGDNIYQLLLAFDEIYESANEVERKEFMKAFIDRIDLYDEKQADGNWIKGITFNFPVPIKTKEGQPYSLEKEMTVETVCLLSKLHEAKHHVNVRLDMDELDITSAESKATYEEIKTYVAEHNDGMKVSNLYIAQVKAKYGIIERENYNKPKSDDARQPKCPKEKEEAIVEALRYFQMISSES